MRATLVVEATFEQVDNQDNVDDEEDEGEEEPPSVVEVTVLTITNIPHDSGEGTQFGRDEALIVNVC